MLTLQRIGFARAVRKLDKLKRGTRNRFMRSAVLAATKPLRKKVIALAPVRTKTLKKSIGRKAKTYRLSSVTVGLVGARHDKWAFATPPGRATPQFINPAKYNHLAERKHRHMAKAINSTAKEMMRIATRVVKDKYRQVKG